MRSRTRGSFYGRFHSSSGQARRIVNPPQQQTGSTQRVVARPTRNSPRRLTLNELLPFPEPVQRLVRLTELGENPGGLGDHAGKAEADVAHSVRRESPRQEFVRLCPFTTYEVEDARSGVGSSDRQRMMRRFGEPPRFRVALGSLSKPAKLGETLDEPVTIVDR